MQPASVLGGWAAYGRDLGRHGWNSEEGEGTARAEDVAEAAKDPAGSLCLLLCCHIIAAHLLA
jgi:hypothetical protein